jgi:hypothetical protein
LALWPAIGPALTSYCKGYRGTKFWLKPREGEKSGELQFDVVPEEQATTKHVSAGCWEVHFHGEDNDDTNCVPFSMHGVGDAWQRQHLFGTLETSVSEDPHCCNFDTDVLHNVPGWTEAGLCLNHVKCLCSECEPLVQVPRLEGGLSFFNDMVNDVYYSKNFFTAYFYPENSEQAERTARWRCPVQAFWSAQFPPNHFYSCL